MKICCVSDLHGTLLNLENYNDCEVLCICGDIIPLNIQFDNIESIAWLCREFFPWIESLPFEKVIMIWGNHDFVRQYLATDRNGNYRKPSRVLKKLLAPSKLILLEDNEFIYKGYKFYGTPWCPNLSRWAYYGNSDFLMQKFSEIPNNVDVLLTHCPPKVETFGTVLQHGFNLYNDYGCEELAEAIKSKAPKHSIFGHVHSGNHVSKKIGETTYCNVSTKDKDYRVSFNPIIIELQ